MKKFLKLFVVLTPLLTAPSMPLNSQINKREITVPSLQDMIRTIDIGTIVFNDLASIIQGLSYRRQGSSDAENTIRRFLLEQYNNGNLTISEINDNYAIAHLNHSHRINNFNIGFIPDTTEFRINFRSIISNTNLGRIENNHLLFVWERLLELNPGITDDVLSFLDIERISQNRAIVTTTNNASGIVGKVEITFATNSYILLSFNFNTNLGQLPNNNPETILHAFIDANHSLLTRDQLQDISVIFENGNAFIHRDSYSVNLELVVTRNIQRLLRSKGIMTRLLVGITIYDRISVTFSLQNRVSVLLDDFKKCFSRTNNHFFHFKKRDVETSNFECFSIMSKKINDKETLVVENNRIFLESSVLGGIILKFDDFNEPIISVELDNSGGANIVTQSNKVYHLDLKNLSATKVANIISTNLNKEITLFYKEDKTDVVIKNHLSRWNYKIVKDFNLGTINPLKYKKIAFIKTHINTHINTHNNFETKIILGKDTYYGNKLSSYNNQDLNNYISNCHVVETADGVGECGGLKTINLQDIDQNISSVHVLGSQKFGLTYYFEDNKFHLQVVVEQEINLNDAWFIGEVSSYIGSAIKLFND